MPEPSIIERVLHHVANVFTGEYWRGLWREKRGVIIRGVILGIVVHGWLLLHPTRLSQWAESAALDWMIRWQSHNIKFRPQDPAFVFIDIDDETVEYWGPVPYTPRDELLKLVKFAVDREPAVVLVDVNLTLPYNIDRKRCQLSKEGRARGKLCELSEQDKALAEYLRDYSRGSVSQPCHATTGGGEVPAGGATPCKRPLIVLNRDLRGSATDCRELRESFLDDYIDQTTGYVQWGSRDYGADSDQVVRYWRLWERTCQNLKYPFVPSVQWLAVWRLQHRYDDSRCLPEFPVELTLRHEQGVPERIIYSIPWKMGNEADRPRVMLPDGSAKVLNKLPAVTISAARPDQPISSSQRIKDTVVVIGGSNEDARDLHETPIGLMPGALIVANSIYSLQRFGPMKIIPLWGDFILEAVLIVMASVIFAMLKKFHLWAYLLAGVITVVLLLPLAWIGLKTGYWLDFAIPLLAVEVHHMFAQIEETVESARGVEA
jgi:CHASE2 domain-containing sensor protein